MKYVPSPAQPKTLEELTRYVQAELQKIAAMFEQLEPTPVVYRAEPRAPRIGRMVIADGTDWNPVGGSAVPKLIVWSGSAWIEIKAFP